MYTYIYIYIYIHPDVLHHIFAHMFVVILLVCCDVTQRPPVLGRWWVGELYWVSAVILGRGAVQLFESGGGDGISTILRKRSSFLVQCFRPLLAKYAHVAMKCMFSKCGGGGASRQETVVTCCHLIGKSWRLPSILSANH